MVNKQVVYVDVHANHTYFFLAKMYSIWGVVGLCSMDAQILYVGFFFCHIRRLLLSCLLQGARCLETAEEKKKKTVEQSTRMV